MQPVDEGHVVTDDLRHGLEQMARLDHDLDRLLGIAEKRNARLSRSGLLATLERARLAVGLHCRDDLLRHLLQIRHLIETDHIPNLDQAFCAASHAALRASSETPALLAASAISFTCRRLVIAC